MMTITINGISIPEDAVEHEARFHHDAPSPAEAARCALAIRELLLQRACAIGLAKATERLDDAQCEEIIERLLEREAPIPEPSAEECRRFYETHRDRFRSGDIVEAAHILFAVTANAPVEAIRGQAEATLKQVRAAPGQFAELASTLSNCPSGAQGGNLGQLQRGDSVPEFDAALFGSAATGILPQLVRTRYGFHIVNVARRLAGRELDFEAARQRIAEDLRARAQAKALEQYVRLLAAQARIEGIDLGAATSPLLR
ncbi:MAG: peptidylprolyl isomerase [Betaproteobacteria bacterium]|nr:peptidylprolyl isomerase [Betaproteobacteria bacterium]